MTSTIASGFSLGAWISERAPYSEPTRWKIQNSWGDENGKKGYYLMSDSWFDHYVYQAVVRKSYLTEQEAAVLSGDLIHLNPWDPMGTLA